MTSRSQAWRKSSYSNSSGTTVDCVEVALGTVVGIRDTKAREAGELRVAAEAWQAFVSLQN